MHIFVRAPGDKTIALELMPTDNVQDMKIKIQASTGISTLLQRLAFQGRLMDSGRTLYDYNVQEGSVLDLTLNSEGTHACNMWVHTEVFSYFGVEFILTDYNALHSNNQRYNFSEFINY